MPELKGRTRDIVPSVQAIINCGTAGSCHGGSVDGPSVSAYQARSMRAAERTIRARTAMSEMSGSIIVTVLAATPRGVIADWR